jgi:hypothetical protein
LHPWSRGRSAKKRIAEQDERERDRRGGADCVRTFAFFRDVAEVTPALARGDERTAVAAA